ncbi:hypothetical protein [Streptomyces tendae]|uniref:hypothetical protein n=1 Tax=Streptomyces tendae TaxID=1932 RepID=UPI0037F828EF
MRAQRRPLFWAEVRWHCRWPIACDSNLTCPGCHPLGTDAGCSYCQALRTRPPRAIRTERQAAWMSRTGPAWWIGYALYELTEFAYVVPRRVACRLLGRHNPTCIGRAAPHPRRW